MLRETALKTSIGFALLLVPVLFITFNVLVHEIGLAVWNPFDLVYDVPGHTALTYSFDALILLGPPAVLVLLVPPLVRIGWRRTPGAFAATVTLYKGSRFTLAVLAASAGTMAVLGAYLAIENLPCILGQQVQC